MADNTKLPLGTLDGDTYASDDIGSVKYQRVKLTLGADGTNDGDVSSTNPIPVSGTITATGGLTDTQLRASAVPVSLASVPSHAVTNAGTFAAQINQFIAAANMANGQVATSGSAGTLVAARATRRSVTIRNLDSSINVYVGVSTVTTANGMLIRPLESVSIDFTGLIQVIAASGTPSVAYMETYD